MKKNDSYYKKKISGLLAALVILDTVIAITAFFFPEAWFKIFHGVAYIDPQAFLKRCAANWAAFALLQIFAFKRWEKRPYWLAVVSGVRFSDIFTDWTWLWFASNLTVFARVSFFVISPLNLALGIFFLNAYKKLNISVKGDDKIQ